jgi:arginine N-succinyltransferase
VAELPFSILQDEGFDADTYVDIFDAGPIVEARLDTLHTVARARRARANADSAEPDLSADARPMHIACRPQRNAFRAVLTPAGAGASGLPAGAALRLGLGPQDAAALSPLSAAALARGAAHV